jgi:hypothetical protein
MFILIKNRFIVISTFLLNLCYCTPAHCQNPPETIKELVTELSLQQCQDNNPSFVRIIDKKLGSKLKCKTDPASPCKSIWYADSSLYNMHISFDFDSCKKDCRWNLELYFPDTPGVRLNDMETIFGKSVFPEWAKKTKSSHFIHFNSLPAYIPPEIELTGRLCVKDSAGTFLINFLRVRRKE